MNSQIMTSIKQHFDADTWNIIPMVGDASARRYSRVQAASGRSLVLMEYGTGPQSLAEEKTPASHTILEPAFINIQRFFAQAQVQVPRIYNHGDGYMLLEDLGDTTLYDWLQKQPQAGEIERHYITAMHELMKIHRIDVKTTQCIATHRRFDAALYNWEFEHFIEYGIEWLCKTKINNKELRNYFASISMELDKLPVCVSHRDFHSKNLMLTSSNQLYVIDFQDAILAPCHYDVVSLLFDSYVTLPPAMIQRLTKYYWQQIGEELAGDSLEQFERELRLMALQRNMKAAGRFVYILAEKKKATHIQYVEPTLRKIEEHLSFLNANQDFLKNLDFPRLYQSLSDLLKSI